MALHVVLFEKKTSLKKRCFASLLVPAGQNCQSWVSMGHFDAIHSYTLSQESVNPFPLVQKNNSWLAGQDSVERHFHPLYLISKTGDDAFWNRSSSFLAISRIHFSNTTGANEVYEKLIKELDVLDPYRETFQLFRTIELCDAVLVGKSDSLRKLLGVTLTLRQNPNIGRVYTYCAVNNDFLNTLKLPFTRETIPLCTIRFAVDSFSKAEKELESIKQIQALKECPPFSVIGVDDIVLFWRDLPVDALLELYRRWFTGTSENTLDAAFSSITTRLGIKADGIGDWPEPDKDEKLHCLCAELETLCEMIMEKWGKCGPAWLQPLSELTHSLVRLSKMPVLDEFVYLMLPGARAFFKRLNEGTPPDHEAFQLFLESWISIMEHIMRGEGQMTQYPQLRPAVFDIPVAMLEYILAFLDGVAALLRKEDKNSSQITLFPVPGLYQRIRAAELFPPENNLPGLVLIEIPLEMLYNPVEMQKALCHELSHFIGETFRCREDRIKRYSQASSVLMAEHLFGCNHVALVHAIDSLLEERLKDKTTVNTMESTILEWVNAFCRDGKDKDALTIRTLEAFDPKGYPLRYVPDLIKQGETANDSDFKQALKDISILFRECFADLCMLYLLPVDRADYIKSLHDDLKISSEMPVRPYEQIAIRIYAVLRANPSFSSEQLSALYDDIFQKLSPEERAENGDFWNLKKETQKLIESLRSKKETKEFRRIPIGAVKCLRNYTALCYEKLSESIDEEDKNNLRRMFEMFHNTTDSGKGNSSPMNYDDFLNRIDSYRRKIKTSNE